MELTNMTIEDVYNQIKGVCGSIGGITYVNGNYLALCKEKRLENGKCGFCSGTGNCNATQYKEINKLLEIADKYYRAEGSDTTTLLRLLDKYYTVVELLQSGGTTRQICDEILNKSIKYRTIEN